MLQCVSISYEGTYELTSDNQLACTLKTWHDVPDVKEEVVEPTKINFVWRIEEKSHLLRAAFAFLNHRVIQQKHLQVTPCPLLVFGFLRRGSAIPLRWPATTREFWHVNEQVQEQESQVQTMSGFQQVTTGYEGVHVFLKKR